MVKLSLLKAFSPKRITVGIVIIVYATSTCPPGCGWVCVPFFLGFCLPVCEGGQRLGDLASGLYKVPYFKTSQFFLQVERI